MPEALAAQVLRKSSSRLPVDVDSIIREQGIGLIHYPFSPSFQGIYVPGKRPLIIVNSMDPLPRRRFTLAHELYHHLYCKSHDCCSVNFYSVDPERLERNANRFSAELLMPKNTVLKMLASGMDISSMARCFLVSSEAMSIRVNEVSPPQNIGVIQ